MALQILQIFCTQVECLFCYLGTCINSSMCKQKRCSPTQTNLSSFKESATKFHGYQSINSTKFWILVLLSVGSILHHILFFCIRDVLKCLSKILVFNRWSHIEIVFICFVCVSVVVYSIYTHIVLECSSDWTLTVKSNRCQFSGSKFHNLRIMIICSFKINSKLKWVIPQ